MEVPLIAHICKRRTGPHMMNIICFEAIFRISPGGKFVGLKFLMFILYCVFSNKGELCNKNTCENNVNKLLEDNETIMHIFGYYD